MNDPDRLPSVDLEQPAPSPADPPADPPGAAAAPPSAADADPSTPEEKALARAQGWRPEEEWEGAPANRRPREFFTAREYLERTSQSMPMLRERLREVGNQNVALTTKVETLEGKLDASGNLIRDMHENMKTVRDRAYTDARADIEREMDEAFESGNREQFSRSRAKMKSLDDEHNKSQLNGGEPPAEPAPAAPAAPTPAAQQQMPPEVEAWVRRHSWFGKSGTLRTAAMEREAELKRQEDDGERDPVSLEQRLDDVADWVETNFSATFPQFFRRRADGLDPQPAPPPATPSGENPRRRAPSTVRQPAGGPPPRQEGLTWDDLTDDEKAAADMCVESVPGYTREKYLKDYKR